MTDRLKSRKGYSLPELMIVVAIIAIICAIGIGGILSQIKSLRQMKLDRTAQTIYTAAQNRLTELYSTGDTASFKEIIKRNNQPGDWDTNNAYTPNETLTVIRSGEKSSDNINYDKDGNVIPGDENREAVKRFILPEGTISEELYNDNWVIELNLENGCVYSVFYSERDSEPAEKFYDEPGQADEHFDTEKIRSQDRSERMTETDARVGYFSAQSNTAGKIEGTTIDPQIIINNANTLEAVFNINKTPLETKLDLIITVTGESSKNSYIYKSKSSIIGGGKIKRRLMLDKLTEDGKEDLSFYKNFCSGSLSPSESLSDNLKFDSKTGELYPGENLKITFEVKNAPDASKLIEESSAVAYAYTNSLYGYSSNGNTETDADGNVTDARIEYARHLQNLDTATSHVKRAEKATQTKDIDFSDTKSGGYANVYRSRSFTPIENTELTAYDGRDFAIRSLTTGSYRPGGTVQNAGLFGIFYGDKLSNIRLVGLKANISGMINAGALAAELSSASNQTVVIDNCRAYLVNTDYDDYKEQDDIYSFIKAENNAGGLIGLSNVDVRIKNSFAATTVEAGIYGSTVTGGEEEPGDSYYGKGAGGLIGWARGSVAIENSYADCYLTGAYIGGLAGFIYDSNNIGSEVTGSYSAGFAIISNETVSSAGFAGNKSTAVVNMKGSYNVLDTGAKTSGINTRVYSTITALAAAADAPEAVYYLNTGSTRENIAGTLGQTSGLLSSEENDAAAARMNEALGTAVFKIDKARDKTSAYSLKKGLGLTNEVYPYPHLLRNGETVLHYCDWLVSELTSGKLVYYEKYSDGKWGFDGNGTTLYTEEQLNADGSPYIVSDGYAVLYDKADYDSLTDKENTISYSYNKAAYRYLGSSSAVTVSKDKIANTIELWDIDSVFLLLPDDVVNEGLQEGGSYSGFYQKLVLNISGVESYYNFAPHFARSVVKTDSEEEAAALSAGDRIYVRTPRQLYLMSEFYASYQTETAGCEFYQEADLDYTKYVWNDSDTKYTSLQKMVDDSRTQTPVADGSSSSERFTAIYNGHYHIITGFSVLADETGNCVGLFGAVDEGGSLKNVVLTAEYAEHKYTLKSEKKSTKIGEKLYLGLLAGYLGRQSEITNCAVASYEITGYSYGSSDIYAGGLVGYNLGNISDSSAVTPQIKIHSNENSDAYVGGFAGYNASQGIIESCYGLAHINAAAFGTTGEYMLGGFAGTNSGSIEKSYCAMSYTSSGIDTGKIRAFTQGIIGEVKSCLYLDGGNYFYVNDVYLYNYPEGETAATYAQPASGGQLRGIIKDDGTADTKYRGYLGDDFGEANESVNYKMTEQNSGGNNYPYPAVVSKGSNVKVHYGEWFFDSSFSDFGFVYWEKEESGTNNGYKYYIIDKTGAEHSTLCESHDDGGIIKAYGYGYYYKDNDSTVTTDDPVVTWDKVNVSEDNGTTHVSGYTKAARGIYNPLTSQSSSTGTGSKAEVVKEAAKALGKAFNGAYVFVLYSTTETGYTTNYDGGMFITDDAAYASCTMEDNNGTENTKKTYLFTPFFGKSMVLTGEYKITEINGTVSTDTDINISEADAKASILGHNTGYVKDVAGADTVKSQKYAEKLEDGFPFEIRSISQLQNLNWRWDKKNAISEVTEEDTKETITTNGPIVTNTETQNIAANTKKDNTKNITNRNWRSVNLDEEVISSDTSTTTSGGITTIVTTERVILAHTERQKVDESSEYWNWGRYYSRVYVDEHEETIETRVTTKVTKTTGSNNYTYLRWYAYGGSAVTSAQGYNYYWKQTHDVNAQSGIFTPIGGLYDTKETVTNWTTDVSAIPYVAYFNGDYNGSSYKIQNINISTESQTVGLFGTTVCARLRNIILYSSNGDSIEAKAPGRNWYMQGSLIGFAGQGTIDNCAVAGYKVVDNRTVDGHGDANVGGFIGFSSTDITNCSSVNEVEINATHSKGINIRVGGLAGICTGTIKNSYCGGSIKSGTKQNVAIYVAGIMGGEWFKGAGLKNLTNIDSFETDADKIKPKLENCYSYVRLPAANFNENRIVYVKVLATVADLDKEALKVLRNAGIINYTESAADPATIEIKNCYYYAAYAGTATNVERHYAKGTIYDVSYLDANGTAIAGGSAATVMGLTYRKMNDELLGKLNVKAQYFKPVTTTENGGVDIKGKYSFPGSDKELQGENYPFPTIITQSNPFYDEDMAGTTESPTVNVHYGEWPKSNGLFIDKASDSIDLLTSASGITEVNIKYYVDGNPVSMDAGTQPGISYSLGTTSDIINCTLTHKTDENGIGYYTLAAEALREGYETITLSYTADGKEYKNAVDISVKAEYVIVITPRVSTNSEIYVGKSVDYILEAYNSSGNKLSLTAANWTADVTDEESEEFINCGKPKDVDGEVVITVTGVSEGTAYISVGTKGITSLTGKPIEGQSRIMTAEVEADPNAAATMVTAMLYSDGMRLGSSSDRPVSVAYATSAGDDAKAGSNLSYWTGVVAGNASEGTGKSFAGWVTEDGESFTSATELNSTVKVMASWECLSISFMDKAEGAGDYTELTRLSYYGGNLYTDNTLSTSAAAPEPYKRSGSDSFSGYWTEPNGGEMIVSSEGAFTKTLPNSGSMKLYARFDVSAEELAALARKKSEEDKAAAEAMSAEPAEKAITDAVSGEITEG